MINWRYIKGLNEDNGASPLYTFLLFCHKINNDLLNFRNVPELKYSETNSITANLINPDDTSNSWGHIITQRAKEQYIEEPFTFNAQVNFKRRTAGFYAYAMGGSNGDISTWGLYTPADASYTNLDFHKPFCIHDKLGNSGNGYTVLHINNADSSSATSYTAFVFNRAYIRLGNATLWNGDGDLSAKRINSDGILTARGKLTVTSGGAEIVAGDLTVTSGGADVAGDITGHAKCQAVYFNATSDKRAKTNLKPLEIDALDLIKRVQLYSFKYKDNDLPSIGILAQDVEDVNIEGFDLVDNKKASGIDMDYMSIHESKLTYILWKAIQEQQKEIDELKAQIKSLIK